MKLYTCDGADGGPKVHPCRRAHDALRAGGHQYEAEVADRNRPFGFRAKGNRPELKELTGQEALPALVLDDGTVIAGSGRIVKWAKANASAG